VADNVEVTILGRKLTLKRSGKDDYIRDIVDFVNKKIGEIHDSSPGMTDTNIAIMASLNIADEYFEALARQRATYEQIDRHCDDLLEYIDSKL
jgi:cell division protein ZapA (FtsZ GTPase activity inhibitor)